MYVINVTDKGALRPFFQSYISLHTRPHNELFFQRQSEKLLGNNFLFQPLKDLMRFFLPHANFAKTIIVYIITGTSDYSTLTINHNQKNFNQAQTATNSIPTCFEFNVEIINRNQNNQFWFSVFWFALLLKNHSKTYFRAYT